MTTVQKGNKLEDQLYDHLLDQKDRGALVFDVYPAPLCTLHKKKKYFCTERGGNIEFDVVVEVRRSGSDDPHLYLLFECKNHKAPIQESDITDFSDKIGRLFRHACKGFIVSTSRLQSGAESIARSRRLGIVKFDENGLDVVADRTIGIWPEQRFVKSQINQGSRRSKPLKFSAYSDERYFGSFGQLLGFYAGPTQTKNNEANHRGERVPFKPEMEIQKVAEEALSLLNYTSGAVDVTKLSAALGLELSYSERVIRDADGGLILGSAQFTERRIEINQHNNPNQERFTIAHEIGHFCLKHDRYLLAESIVERDLYIDTETEDAFNFERLEIQANLFGSMLLLPEKQFRWAVAMQRQALDIQDRGFGYIFVDHQRCNYVPYYQLLTNLSQLFGASKQAVEIRLKRSGLVTDQRRTRNAAQVNAPFAWPQ